MLKELVGVRFHTQSGFWGCFGCCFSLAAALAPLATSCMLAGLRLVVEANYLPVCFFGSL